MTLTRLLNPLLTNHKDLQGQKRRYETFDLLRGLAVLFMVAVHVLGSFANQAASTSLLGYIIEFLGGPPAAPVFMLSMGIFFVLSRKNDDLRTSIYRGLKLLLLGCLLSFLRSDIIYIINGDFQLQEIFNPSLYITFWEVDILQFAGWAYIFMALIKKVFKKAIWWILLAIGIMVASPYLWGISSQNSFLNWLLNYLWGNSELTYFPLFPWLYYPLMGMVIGLYMKSFNPKDLYKILLIPGLILFALAGYFTLSDLQHHFNNYFHSYPALTLWITGFLFVYIYLSHLVSEHAIFRAPLDLISNWGKFTPSIYFIHWLMVAWSSEILGLNEYGIGTVILLTSIILTLSYLIAKGIKSFGKSLITSTPTK